MGVVRVMQLWRFPVKSLQGERVATAPVGPRGIAGDRGWGIVDVATGYVLGAKKEPRLLLAGARVTADGVAVTLPDGTAADDESLSAWLGRPVRLTRADADRSGTYEIAADFERESDSDWISWQGPVGSFHDSTKVALSVASTGSFGSWDARRFRMNVIVDGAGEETLVGRVVRLGTVVATVVKPVDRCVMVTRAQPGLERDLDVLRTINRERGTFLGIGLRIDTAGTIAEGDELIVAQ
jgi:uncharacterized protein YcbX